MTLGQIASHWWAECKAPAEVAQRRLKELIGEGFINPSRVLACELPSIDNPIATWFPGQPELDFGAIAWQLQSRWKSPPQLQSVFLASPKAAKLFGGKAKGKLKRQYQATHDLGVAQMYLQVHAHRPHLIREWIGEDVLAPFRQQQKLPDAIISRSPLANPTLVLEFGGAYDKQRIAEFHRDCEQRSLPYEIW